MTKFHYVLLPLILILVIQTVQNERHIKFGSALSTLEDDQIVPRTFLVRRHARNAPTKSSSSSSEEAEGSGEKPVEVTTPVVDGSGEAGQPGNAIEPSKVKREVGSESAVEGSGESPTSV